MKYERRQKQECIPVGCVPPAAVAISPTMHALLVATHAPPRHTRTHAPLPREENDRPL